MKREPCENTRPLAVDLFAGAGGMSLGFELAGFTVAAAVEMDPVHCAVHEYNFPECAVLCRSETEVSGGELKRTRWLLLKNPENLDETKDEPRRLREALELNAPLALAYYMKEDLRQVWKQAGKRAAKMLLSDWIRRAACSGIGMLIKFSKTLAMYRNQILAYYDYGISTGPLEGTNTKIRVLQHDAYGFRDKEFFKLRIYALHETRFKLIG